MAIITVTPAKIPLSGEGVLYPEFQKLTSVTDGGRIDFSNVDTKTIIMIENAAAAAKTVTFKKGDSIQGASDLVVSIPAYSVKTFVLESGKFKMTQGANKGYVTFTGESVDIGAYAMLAP